MTRRLKLGVLALLVLGLGLSACAEAATEEAEPEPSATIEEVKGTELKWIVLAEGAAGRLGLRMTPITGEAGAARVPYGAVVYDARGRTWVYVRPEPRRFRRVRVTVSDVTGNDVTLSAGPDVGTPIVTRGAAELFGAEDEIGAEEPE